MRGKSRGGEESKSVATDIMMMVWNEKGKKIQQKKVSRKEHRGYEVHLYIGW